MLCKAEFITAIVLSLLIVACNTRQPVKVPAADTAVAITAPPAAKGPDYNEFLDSLLDRDSISYDPPLQAFGQEGRWSDEWGFELLDPPRFQFGKKRFSLTKAGMQIVNKDGDRLYGIRYETDTAFTFRFHGRKYGWAAAHYYMCNGTGCLEAYYLLADFSRSRLYTFVTMAVPSYDTYFGDVNHDGKLDVLIPDYLYYPGSGLPYSDTIEYMTLTPYSQNNAGDMEAIRQDGRDCQYTVRFRSCDLDACNLEVLGCFGSFWY